jgi:hypothetical protein
MPENNLDYIPLINLGIWKTTLPYINIEDLIDYLYNLKNLFALQSSKSNIGGYQSPDNLYLDSNFFSLVNIINKIHNDITSIQILN